MAPPELIAWKACCVGIPADLNAPEVNSHYASRVCKRYLQQRNDFLTRDELGQKCFPEDEKYTFVATAARPGQARPQDGRSKTGLTREERLWKMKS
jgi:hypothetical protein